MTMPDQQKLIEDLFAALHSIDHKLGELIDLTRGEKLARVSAARQRAEQPRSSRSPFTDPPVDVEAQIERVLERRSEKCPWCGRPAFACVESACAGRIADYQRRGGVIESPRFGDGRDGDFH